MAVPSIPPSAPGPRIKVNSLTGDASLQYQAYNILLNHRAAPLIVLIGDSTLGYGFSATGSALSAASNGLVYNGDGTATISFSIDQGIYPGDPMGVQGAADRAYNVPCDRVCLARSGTGPFSYTYALRPGMVPSISPDTATTPATVMLGNRLSAYCIPGHLRFLAGSRFNFVNLGIGGDTSTDVLQRFAYDVAPYQPDEVWLVIGINDVWKSMTLAQTKANIPLIHAQAKALGARFRMIGPPPQKDTKSGWTLARQQQLVDISKFMDRYASANGCLFVAGNAVAAGNETMTNALDANGNPNTGMLNPDDWTHYTNKGGYMVAKEAVSDLVAPFLKKFPGLARSVLQGGFVTNPLFQGSSGTGSVAAGAAGATLTLPGGSTTNTTPVSGAPTNTTTTITVGSAATSVTGSVTPRTVANDGDDAGNWFMFNFVAAAAGDQFTVKLQNLAPSLANGSKFRTQLQGKIFSGATFLKEFSMGAVEQIGGNVASNRNHDIQRIVGNQAAALPEGFTGEFYKDTQIRAASVFSGSVTAFQWTVTITAAAAGTSSIGIACYSEDFLP